MLNLTGGGLLVFAVLAAAALFSLWLYPHLPEDYRSAETTSNMRLGMGVLATITAVVLGLSISSVKGHFVQASRDVQALGADLIVLDRTLRFYGPDAAHVPRFASPLYGTRAGGDLSSQRSSADC